MIRTEIMKASKIIKGKKKEEPQDKNTKCNLHQILTNIMRKILLARNGGRYCIV